MMWLCAVNLSAGKMHKRLQMQGAEGLQSRVLWKAEPARRVGPLGRVFVAFDLQFWPHAANIGLWTFGPVVVTVCRFARTGDLRTE